MEKLVNQISKFYLSFKCCVALDNNNNTEWFDIETGVRQGCLLSPILFILAIDWVMRKTTGDRKRGIQWGLFNQLEDLDFADYLALLASNHRNMQEKSDRLVKYAKQVGLYVNTDKTEAMNISNQPNQTLVMEGKEIQFVEKFTYLGSVISKDNGENTVITSRLSKARHAFSLLTNIKQVQYENKVETVQQKCKICTSLWFRVLEGREGRYEQSFFLP